MTGSLEARVRAINAAMEDLIRQCPEQYLWGYNRYKVPAGAEPPPAVAEARAG
jgi:KDO2-lipid IV(A) lauroyltransferase